METLLTQLPDNVFVRVFRRFLDISAYPYPDATLLDDRGNAIRVLLAHATADEIRRVVRRVQANEEQP